MAEELSLTICSKAQVRKHLSKYKYDAIISINNPDAIRQQKTWKDYLLRHTKNVLFLSFWDEFNGTEPDGPQKHHISSIVTFSRLLKEQPSKPKVTRVLIHCFAGISRSAAAGIILLREHNLNHEEAYGYVRRIRSIAMPNSYMIKLYEDQLPPSPVVTESIGDLRVSPTGAK